MLAKAVEKAKKLNIGDPTDRKTYMGAVIDEKAFKKISEYIDIGKKEGKVVLGGKTDGSKGYFIEPTIIADVEPQARLSQEEIFGPVLSFIRARDYDHALEIANNTEFGLTGAVFSRSREN